MKKSFYGLLLLLAALVLSPPVVAQSAKKIVDRYNKAVGSKAIKRVKSVLISGTVKSAEGAQGRFTYHAQTPDRLRIDIETARLKVSECYNGKSAWRLDERGLRTLLGAEAKRLRLEAVLANSRLRDLSRNRISMQLAGKATIDGRETSGVEFVKESVRVKIFFDASTNLPVKQERETSAGLQEVFYGDYRAVDGVMEPFSIRIKNGEQELLVAVDRVEHNRTADETAFRHPEIEGGRPLPDVETLMKAVVANQEKIEGLREHYTFRETETESKLDGNGRVKESETKVYEVTPVAGDFVQRLISVNGKELSPSELEKEDRKVQKEVEKALKRREKEQKEKEKARDKEEEDERDITILSFLRLSEITSVRREVFRGHEVIAFDFEPRKNARPKGRAETLVSKLAGTLWVDEDAQQIARLEARLMDSFKIGGGLFASVAPSTAIAFEQEKIGDELWLPSYAEANIFAKIFLFAKFNRSVVTRFSDYRKYNIDSEYELERPKEKARPDGRPQGNSASRP
ncbi:MAG: hypothetical protein L0229_01705 [Blastocatellia bacterium]|nr:hypothetical protein [Blastocatellia bacterium]